MSAESALHWLGATDAADRIRRKDLSPVELTRALIDRIATHDSAYNAFITFTPDAALAEAKRAESAVMAGTVLGPLHGVPYGLKDIIDAAGLPTTCHSAILKRNVASTDAEVARRLRAAGGILLGKLSTHEFALGGPAFDLPFPPARNPWNRNIGPGGSSSGAGVAVAAGFVPLALGTDTGGSIRNPASQCGIVGLKGTYGRVSRRGVFPLAFGLDHVGPMTRTVADNALLMSVLAGHDPADRASSDRAVPDFRAALGQGIRGLRIGVFRHFHARDMIASPAVADAIERALVVMRAQGAEVVEIATAPLADYATCNRIILLSEACAVHGAWLKERPQDYSRMTRERLLPGLFVSAVDYIQAMRWRSQLIDQMNHALATVDVAIAASSMDPPHAIDDAIAIEKYYPRQARTPFNLTGHPALAMPAGFTDDGLPLSFQIVGNHFDESTVYRVASAYEQATRWHERHPLLEHSH
jgi:aspartyl-tRNA(Asn)/glutamyl-tRNA(Gln) amidotransferase subunit A